MPSSDYKQAYESAKAELADLIATQDKVARRILVLRENLKALSALCESEEVWVEPSAEADYLLAHSTLAQDIQSILQAEYPGWQRPHQVKAKLERIGHDLGKYKNAQATIHMVLKRMVESEEAQENVAEDGKQIYRFPPMWQSISDRVATYAGTSGLLENIGKHAQIAGTTFADQIAETIVKARKK
jgi:DNA repair ATPase RecN